MKNKFALSIICFLLYAYIRLVYFTSFWKITGSDNLKQKLKNKEPVILTFWHGRLAMMSNFVQYPKEINVMISRHGDGELIARVIGFFRLRIIRGSTNRPATDNKGAKNRGGSGALRQAIKILGEGQTLCITPDGPKGPRMRVSSAVVELARHTGTPIYPLSFSSSNCRIFKSWDRFLFPFPLGRAYFICGEPVTVASNADNDDLEKSRKELENRLNTITHKADEMAGLARIEPADVVT